MVTKGEKTAKNTVLVVKKKKSTKKRPLLRRTAAQSRGLPSAKAPVPREEEAPGRDPFDLDDEDDSFLDNAPCDTYLAIQSLQRNENSSIAIPIGGQGSIRAILECQLYPMLQDNNGDAIVSQEIRQLLNDNVIRRLSATQQSNSLSVLVPTQQYVEAVQDARAQKSGRPDITDWFLRHLKDWTGKRIATAALEESYKKDPIHHSLESILQALQNCQVLMPEHSHGSYQLWLPAWGTVLQAWEKARKNLLLQLKRSYQKERSVAAVNQPYSPIPTTLLIEWLIAQGDVQSKERPSGKFIQLPKES